MLFFPLATAGCPVNFEFLNYTIITSKCKGPRYPPNICCAAFKEFACPYTDVLNDLTNDCASTMFSYINLYGKYPPGLFASECREGKEGLACPATPPTTANDTANQIMHYPSLILMLSAGFLMLLFQWFFGTRESKGFNLKWLARLFALFTISPPPSDLYSNSLNAQYSLFFSTVLYNLWQFFFSRLVLSHINISTIFIDQELKIKHTVHFGFYCRM